MGLGTGKNANAEQDAEQQSRHILGDEVGPNRAFSLRRFDRASEERLDFAQAFSDQRAQLTIVRSDFKCRVDQKAAASLAIVQRALNDFLDKLTMACFGGSEASSRLIRARGDWSR